MIFYKIHQIKDIANTDYAFSSFRPGIFNFGDYECRYSGEFVALEDKTSTEICDVIFHIFNVRRPPDFTGHSLSVSDIIELNVNGSKQFYYCDRFGYSRLNRHDLKIW
jgi:hypothetical protein